MSMTTEKLTRLRDYFSAAINNNKENIMHLIVWSTVAIKLAIEKKRKSLSEKMAAYTFMKKCTFVPNKL